MGGRVGLTSCMGQSAGSRGRVIGVGHLHRSQALARVSEESLSQSVHSPPHCYGRWWVVGVGQRLLPVWPLVSALLLEELIYSTGINWEPGFRIRDLAVS